MARYKIGGGPNGGLGGVLSGDIGDVTYAAMTNLESENKTSTKTETEEDEEEVYGIFTGNISKMSIFLVYLVL